MDKQNVAALLAAVKANEEEWEYRLRQCGRRIITAVTFRESARSTCEKTGSTLLPVIGYYYSLFHISVASLYFDHKTAWKELKHLKHANLRRLVQERLVNSHLLSKDIMKLHEELLELRETANYVFGGKMHTDNMRYWEKVPKLYDETTKVFEECLVLIHEQGEVVDEGLGRQRALATWIDDGIGNDAFRNYLSRSDEELVNKFLGEHNLHS